MKKKLTMLVLCFALVFAMIPSAVYASNVTKAQEFEENSLEDVKQMCKEMLYMAYDESVISKNRYDSLIWKEIISTYNAEINHINSATDVNDLVTYDSLLGILLGEESLENHSIISGLGEMTLNVFSTKKDLSRLKSDKIKEMNKTWSLYKSYDYNQYYWSIFTGRKSECLKAINKSNSSLSFIKASVLYNKYFTDYFDEEEDLEEVTKPIFKVYISEIVYYENQLYSKRDLEQLRKNCNMQIDNFVERQLPRSNYKGSKKTVKSKSNAIKKAINKAYSAEDIITKTVDGLEKIQNYTKIRFEELSQAEKASMMNKIDDLFYKNKKSNYTEKGYEELEAIYGFASNSLEAAMYKVELPKDFVAKTKKAFDKVDTYKEKLSKSKASAISKLKKYKGNKKYNQKKLSPIVKKAIKQIRNCKSLTSVANTLELYKEKAEATVKKYSIKTLKVGKGSITASKTVKYGSSATIKILPKAGYKIKTVYKDGKKMKLRNTYTIKNIKRNYKFKVVFSQ